MKAIIFAAGVGKRLQTVTQGKPKCLVHIGRQTLLSRHIECLQQLGVSPIVLVVGFAQEAIREAMARDFPTVDIRWVVNDQFVRGSITSLWAARHEMDDDVVLMDADVLYAPEILACLVQSPQSSALLMDETVKQESEECMIAAQGGRVLSLSKSLPSKYEEAGEGVGFLKVQQADIPRCSPPFKPALMPGRSIWNMRMRWRCFSRDVPVGYEKIGGLPWVEIDFPEDIQRAVTQILPAIEALEKRSSGIAVP